MGGGAHRAHPHLTPIPAYTAISSCPRHNARERQVRRTRPATRAHMHARTHRMLCCAGTRQPAARVASCPGRAHGGWTAGTRHKNAVLLPPRVPPRSITLSFAPRAVAARGGRARLAAHRTARRLHQSTHQRVHRQRACAAARATAACARRAARRGQRPLGSGGDRHGRHSTRDWRTERETGGDNTHGDWLPRSAPHTAPSQHATRHPPRPSPCNCACAWIGACADVPPVNVRVRARSEPRAECARHTAGDWQENCTPPALKDSECTPAWWRE